MARDITDSDKKMNMMQFFELEKNGTDIKTEVAAGVATFFVMPYIMILIPCLMVGNDIGSPMWNSVLYATCISSAVATILMGMLANKPYAVVPGVGVTSFLSIITSEIVAETGMSYGDAFRTVLTFCFFEGIIMLLLAMIRIREKVVESIPIGVKLGLVPAIGAMLINRGFGNNVTVFNSNGSGFMILKDFFGSLTPRMIKDNMGDESYGIMVFTVITVFLGLFLIIILYNRNVKNAILWGMLFITLFRWVGKVFIFGLNPFVLLKDANLIPHISDLFSETFFKMNFANIPQIGVKQYIAYLITCCLLDLFDTTGSIVAMSTFKDDDGNKKMFIPDAIGTIVGALCGSSPMRVSVASAAAITTGGRTGLTAVVTGIMYLLCIILWQVANIIPEAATSAILVFVGIYMLKGLARVDFCDISQTVPAFLMIITILVTESIVQGVGIGLLAYVIVELSNGKVKEIPLLTFAITALFLLRTFWII